MKLKQFLRYLYEEFHNKKLPLKELLLDQTIISGLGNIYADEVCFMAKLNPNIKACDVKDEDLEALETILASNQFDRPVIKMSVYKNRRGRYKGIIMFLYTN